MLERAMLAIVSVALGVILMGCGNSSCPVFTLNPGNKAAPLARVLMGEVLDNTTVTVAITDVAKKSTAEYDFGAQSGSVELPLIGFRAGGEHTIKVTANKCEQTLSWTAPAMPPSLAGGDVPPLNVTIATPSKMQPGFMLTVVRRRPAMGRTEWNTEFQNVFFRTWSTVLMLNADGDCVWYYMAGRRIGGVTQLKDGTLFMLPDQGGIAQIVDLKGDIVARYYAKNRPGGKPDVEAIPIEAEEIHHMPKELPNGNLLMMTSNTYDIDEWYSSEFDESAPMHKPYKIMADNIVEMTRAGEVVWNWNAHDYLPKMKIGYESLGPFLSNRGFPGVADWTHGNGVDYDESDNTVLMSLRVQDIFIKVNKSTKEIVWMLGPHDGWPDSLKSKLLTKKGDNMAWTYHGHNPHPAQSGDKTVMVYNNDIYQARPFGGKAPPSAARSRAMEYKIDEKTMSVELLWNSTDPCISWAMGDAHVLPNNNRMVCDAFCQVSANQMPTHLVKQTDLTWQLNSRAAWTPNDFPMHGRIREYFGRTSEVIFEVIIRDPSDICTYEVFNAGKIPNLYGTQAVETPKDKVEKTMFY